MASIKGRLKYIFLITGIILSILAFGVILSQEDYYQNTVSGLEETEYGLYGYETTYLYPGSYNLEISSSSDAEYSVEIIKLDTSETIGSKRCSGSCSIDFSINSLSKGIGTRITTEDSIDEFKDAYYCSYDKVYADSYLITILMIAGFAGILVLLKKRNKVKFLLLGTIVFVCIPLISKDLKSGHDLLFHLDRIFNIGIQYSKGFIIPRINEASIYSLGSITPMLYPELFLYIPGLLVRFNCSVVLAYKLLCVFANVVTVLIAYYVGTWMVNKKIALVFAILYSINPYRMNEIFIRAALGELLAMSFMPLAFYGVYLLIQKDYRKGVLISAIGISCLFQSNIVSTYIFLIFASLYAFVYILFDWKSFVADRKRILYILFAIIVTVGLNAWFVVPFLKFNNAEYWVINNKKYLSTHAGSFSRLFSDTYCTNYSASGMTISVGGGTLFGLLSCIYALVCYKLKNKKLLLFCTLFGMLGVLLSSDVFPWDFVQFRTFFPDVIGVIQFPWRFQMMSCLFLNAAIAILIQDFNLDNKNIFSCAIIVLCLLSSLNCVNGYANINNKEMLNKSDCDRVDVNYDYFIMNDTLEAAINSIKGRLFSSDNSEASFRYSQNNKVQNIYFSEVSKNTTVELPIYYYDGLYTAKVNSEYIDISVSENNLLQIEIDGNCEEGSINVSIDAGQFIISDCISLAFIAVICAFYYKEKKKRI